MCRCCGVPFGPGPDAPQPPAWRQGIRPTSLARGRGPERRQAPCAGDRGVAGCQGQAVADVVACQAKGDPGHAAARAISRWHQTPPRPCRRADRPAVAAARFDGGGAARIGARTEGLPVISGDAVCAAVGGMRWVWAVRGAGSAALGARRSDGVPLRALALPRSGQRGPIWIASAADAGDRVGPTLPRWVVRARSSARQTAQGWRGNATRGVPVGAQAHDRVNLSRLRADPDRPGAAGARQANVRDRQAW